MASARSRMSPRTARSRQAGFSLIEVLVSVLVFSLGVMGMVAMQGQALRMATDAQQRAEASYLADQLFARALLAGKAGVSSMAHHPGGTERCAPTGAASTHALVTEWLEDVTETLPLAQADEQQIIVSGDDITVRMCWTSAPGEEPHVLDVRNRVQWQ